MDLPVTTPMLIEHNTKVLHLESTDVCQAACPLCPRETNVNFDKNHQHHLSFDQIVKVFDIEQIKMLNKMFMCGNYGDPAAGAHTLDIYQQFKKLNPQITLGMNTNGAIQNTTWWHELSKIMNQPTDYVIFSIDGLEDTNHIYRKNVSWSKLMKNVSSFIQAGGSAHWDMLVYQHNEHQIEECENLARKMGFKWFRAKVSKRRLVQGLQYPSKLTPITQLDHTYIDCHAVKEKSVYIDARGRLHPCCWLGSNLDNHLTLADVAATWRTESPDSTCKKICSSASPNSDVKTIFSSQWRIEKQL